MAAPLLQTKLCLPPPRPDRVVRPRLIERLDDGLRLGRKLTLLSAPAGFGKTTLLSAWGAKGSCPVAWLSLDEADNDPAQFLTYLVAALQQLDAAIGQTVQQIQPSPQGLPIQVLMASLINDLAAAGKPLLLVLDDYHLITSPEVQRMVQFLLENQPQSLHLVISTRHDPSLPLPRLRARGQVTEIRERDLRFTEEETAAFLNQTMGLDLSTEAMMALGARAEGWIAGLQLAALALQEEHESPDAFIATFTGDDRYIMDYLITEVLQRQPAPLRDFLLQTSVLDRLSAPLCNAVTGREDSQAVLEQLEAANLFVIPLDHRREWYRYYQLFAGFLRAMLGREEQASPHQRAARWYEAHGFLSQAIRHALAYGEISGEMAEAERLIGMAVDTTLHAGGLQTISTWLAALPDSRVRSNPDLSIYKASVLILAGDLTLAEEYTAAAERALTQIAASSEVQAVTQAKFLLLRGLIALGHRDYRRAAELSTVALPGLEAAHPNWRIQALWTIAEAHERTGRATEAIKAFREAQRVGRSVGNPLFTIMVESSLASSMNDHGERREALAACEEALTHYVDERGHLLPLVGVLFSRMGTLYYEANQLGLSREYHDKALAMTQRLASDYAYHLQTLAVPTLYAQGEVRAALEVLEKAHRVTPQEGLAEWDWFLAHEANFHLRQGDLRFALQWAEAARLSSVEAAQEAGLQPVHIEEYLTYVRVLLSQRQLAEARHWLECLEVFARERELNRWLITIHILQALVMERLGDRPAARNHLAQAVALAAPQAYFRAFLDEDPQVLALLPEIHHADLAFVEQLLIYAQAPLPRQEVWDQPLIEPLSERELEVLRLLANGLSNKEIGQSLFITAGTVKQHLKNIYGKLEAHNRTEATARARELHLL